MHILVVFIMSFFGAPAIAQGIDSTAPQANGTKPDFQPLPDLSKEHEFDGIETAKYSKFWDKWHLITVRYRKDNNEQRFIYANDLAYKSMQAGTKVYPDGSMFGKVAFLGQEDPAFPNSLEPHGFTRIQLMEKNLKKYPEENGWGYVLYAKGSGIPYKEMKTTVIACHACHKLVPERDFVFSKSSFFGGGETGLGQSFNSQFKLQLVKELSPKAYQALKATGAKIGKEDKVKILNMPLFVGSVHESIEPLIQFSQKDHTAYLLIDEKSGFFIAAVPVQDQKSCEAEIKMAQMNIIHSGQVITQGHACSGKVTWDH